MMRLGQTIAGGVIVAGCFVLILWGAIVLCELLQAVTR